MRRYLRSDIEQIAQRELTKAQRKRICAERRRLRSQAVQLLAGEANFMVRSLFVQPLFACFAVFA